MSNPPSTSGTLVGLSDPLSPSNALMKKGALGDNADDGAIV